MKLAILLVTLCFVFGLVHCQWSQKNYDQFQSMHVPLHANNANWFNQFQAPNFLYSQTILDSLVVDVKNNQAILALQYHKELALLKINMLDGAYQYVNVSAGEIHENLHYISSVIDSNNNYYILLDNEKDNKAYLFKVNLLGGGKTQMSMLPISGVTAMVYSEMYDSLIVSMSVGVVSLNCQKLSQNWKLNLKEQSKIHLLTQELDTEYIYISFMDSLVSRIHIENGQISGQIKLHNGTVASISKFKNDPNSFLVATITNTLEMTDYIALFNIDRQISVQNKLLVQNIRGTFFQAYCNPAIGFFNSTKPGVSEYNAVISCGLLQRSPIYTINYVLSLKFTVNQFNAIEMHQMWEKKVDEEDLKFVAYNQDLNQIITTNKDYLLLDSVTGRVLKTFKSNILNSPNGVNGFKYLTDNNGKIYAIGVDPSQVISFESL